jgi:hypothetical protein
MKNMKKTTLAIIIAILICNTAVIAQTKKTTVEGYGMWDIVNITPEKARTLAMERARMNALENAKVGTDVTTESNVLISDLVNKFVSVSNLEIQGEFESIKVVDEYPEILSDKRLIYKVHIKAVVKVGKVKKDLEFDAAVNGFSNTYRENENLTFSVKPSKDCYLHIFWFDETGKGEMLYPNDYEPITLFNADTEYFFPQTKGIAYTQKKETDIPIEATNYVFVFTKDKLVYTETGKKAKTDLDRLYEWIVKIPSDRRIVKNKAIYIGENTK